jgi:hypothetical protein
MGLYFAGGINILIGLLFIGLGLFIPDLGIMSVIGAVELVIGAVLAFFGFRRQRGAARDLAIVETGLHGSATILESRQTGWYVNNLPQVALKLRVSVPGQADYDAEHKEVFSYVDVGRLVPGTQLEVRVDPDDQQHLVLEWESAADQGAAPGAAAMPAATMPVFDSSAPLAGVNSAAARLALTRIQQSGLDGTGTLMSFEDLGPAPDGNHNVKYDLLVAVPGRAAQTLHKETELPAIAISLMQVGKTFSLKLDPANPDHPMVAIV